MSNVGDLGGPPPNGLAKQLAELLKSTFGKIAALVIGGVTATVIAVVSPLQDIVRNQFWPEDITLGQTIRVVEGEPAPLSVLLKNNSSVAGISGGVVTVSSPNEAIRLAGQSEFPFDAAKGSLYVKPADGLTVEAQTFGTQRLAVHVKTNRGKEFAGEIKVEAAPRKIVASTRNLSGGYRVILNGVHGQMQLKEFAKGDVSFSGISEFDNGEKLQFSGWRDGTVFFAKFMQGQHLAYKAEGIYCVRGPKDAQWIVVNARVVRYSGLAPTPAKPQATMKEKCEGYPDALADVEGDGVFFASVVSN